MWNLPQRVAQPLYLCWRRPAAVALGNRQTHRSERPITLGTLRCQSAPREPSSARLEGGGATRTCCATSHRRADTLLGQPTCSGLNSLVKVLPKLVELGDDVLSTTQTTRSYCDIVSSVWALIDLGRHLCHQVDRWDCPGSTPSRAWNDVSPVPGTSRVHSGVSVWPRRACPAEAVGERPNNHAKTTRTRVVER